MATNSRVRRRGAASGVRHRDSRGAAAVEFALVMIPMVILLLGSIEYGWYFYSTQATSSAVREAARRLVVGDCQNPSNAARDVAAGQANVNQFALQWGAPGATDYTVSTPGTLPGVGSTLRVVGTSDARIIDFLPLPTGGIVTKVVDARVEDTTASGSC